MGHKLNAHQPSRLHVTSIVWVITRGTQCFEDGRLDYGALPIGRLLTLVGLQSELIRGFSLPTLWKQLHNLYRELGLVATERWRLCTGSTQAPHVPHLMSPIVEDLYEALRLCIVSVGLI